MLGRGLIKILKFRFHCRFDGKRAGGGGCKMKKKKKKKKNWQKKSPSRVSDFPLFIVKGEHRKPRRGYFTLRTKFMFTIFHWFSFLFFVGQSGTKFVCLFFPIVYWFVFICRAGCFFQIYWTLFLFHFQPTTAADYSVTWQSDLYYCGDSFYLQL